MPGWKIPGLVMEESLYIETMDEVVKFFVDKITDETIIALQPSIITVIPANDSDMPLLAFWTFSGDFTPENKYKTVRSVGKKIGHQGIQIAAMILVNEAWMVVRDNLDDIPDNVSLEDVEGRVEIISILGLDIDSRYAQAQIALDRNPDNNSLIVAGITRAYPPGPEAASIESDLMRACMTGYLEGVHLEKFGVPIDPNNPTKYIDKSKSGS